MQFHWGKAKLFGDITVFNFSCFINLELENSKQLCIIRLYYKLDRLSYRFSFNPFCGQGTRSNCRPTSKSFEFRIYDIAIIINFDLNQQKNDDKKIFRPQRPTLKFFLLRKGQDSLFATCATLTSKYKFVTNPLKTEYFFYFYLLLS